MKAKMDVNTFISKLKEFTTLLWSTDTEANMTTKLKEIKLLVLTNDKYVIQEAFQELLNESCSKFNTMTIITMFHVVGTSDLAAQHMLRLPFEENPSYIAIFSEAADKYLDIFYPGMTTSDVTHTVREVWKSYPKIELLLQMTYLDRLLDKKEYKKFKYCVSSNMEFFATRLEENINNLEFARTTSFTATSILYLLHCLIVSNSKPGQSIFKIVPSIQCFSLILNQGFCEGLYQYLILLHEEQMPFASHLIHHLLHSKNLNYSLIIRAIVLASVRLMENKYHEKSKNFLRQNLKCLQGVTSDIINNLDCRTRHGYCLILLKVLHDYNLCEDAYGIELSVALLRSLKLNIARNIHMEQFQCYCYMGSAECGLDSHTKDRLVTSSKCTETCSHSKSFEEYSNLYKRHRGLFLKKLEQLNCTQNKDPSKSISVRHLKDERYCYEEDEDDNFITENYSGVLIDDARGTLFEILEHVANDCKDENELKEFVKSLCGIDLNPEKEILYIEAISNSVYIKLKKEQSKIAQFILNINKDIQECSLLTKITSKVAEYLSFDEKVIKDKKKVIYKCFCKVRHAVINTENRDIYMDVYREHFTFIRYMEREDEMEKAFKFSVFLIIVMRLLMGSSYGGHHKSAEMKKYLSLKYEYDKAILYLLWCSGDVEINPGPTLSKLKSLPASQKLRAWIGDMCSVSLKMLKRIPVNGKPKDLWKDKPANWPCDQPFYDPRNKSKGHNEDVKSDESLLRCILDLCYKQGIDLSKFQTEIDAWRDNNKKILFDLHTCRKEIQTINTAIQCLINYKDATELHQILEQMEIQIDFSVQNCNNENLKGTRNIRGVAVLFCKVALGIHPMEKRDRIWTTAPNEWKKERPFYDPNNAGRRSERGQDTNLVNDLLEYIETHNLDVPSEYAALVGAWKEQNIPKLLKIYTLHTHVAVIENSLRYLQQEGLVDKPDNLEKLKHIGLTLSTKWINGCNTSSRICDSMSNCPQSTYNDQSIAQQTSVGLNTNGQNGNKCVVTDNSINASNHRKRLNTTLNTCRAAEEQCHYKKSKLRHDSNTALRKKRQKLYSDNATQLLQFDALNMRSKQQIKNGTDVQDIDFSFASKHHQDIATDILSPSRQRESKSTAKSSLKPIDKEIAEIRKKLQEEPPKMDDLSLILDISTDELFHIIDRCGLLGNFGTDILE